MDKPDMDRSTSDLIRELRALRKRVAELEERRSDVEGLAPSDLVECVPDGVFVSDGDGTLVHVNQTACQMTGLVRRELAGRCFRELVDEAVADDLADHLRTAHERGQAPAITIEARRENGAVRCWSIRSVKLSENRFVSFARDITEEQRASEALRLSEEKFEKAYNNRAILMTISEIEDGRYVDVNDCFVSTTGFERSEAVGRTSTELGFIAADSRRQLKELLERDGRIESVEIELHRKDGSPLYCLYFGEIIEIEGAKRLLSIAIDITRRREAELALARSEQLVESVFEHGSVGFFVVDVAADGTLEHRGPRSPQPLYENLADPTGGAKGAATGSNPSQMPAFEALLAKAVATKGRIVSEQTTCADGDTKWWLTTVTPLLDDTGGVWRLICSTLDITENRRMEQDLEESRRLYRTLFEASPGAVMVLQDGRYRVVNPAAARLLGYDDPNDVKGLDALSTIAPESREAVLSRMASTRSGHANPPVCMSVLRRDGRVIVSESTSVPIDVEGRKATMVLGQDVTAKLEADRALKESEERYRMLFETAHDAILVADPNTGAMLDCNKKGEELTGYSRQELRRLHQADLHPPEERSRYEASFQRAVERKEHFKEIEVVHRSGRRIPVEISSGGIVQAGARKVHFGIFRDISERRATEQERRHLERQLVHAQKMEALGRLAGGIAHDFNNLLTGIMGNVSLGRMDLRGDDPLQQTLAEIEQGAHRAAGLVRQILAFSRRTVLEASVVSPNEMLMNLERLFGRLIGEDVELTWELEAPIRRVKVDPVQFEQVIINLVVNARDAMPTGGRLVIRTRNAGTREAPSIEISVTDTGHGMDEATIERIFEPFFTTKQDHEGTGLGLATAYGIVTQHNGTLEVQSTPGAGTTFTISLPSVEERTTKPQRTDDPDLPGGRERLLVVEDDPFVRKLAVRILERLGYCVHQAGSGSDAIVVAEGLEQPVDLLLTDIVMPRIGGRELAERIAARQSGVRVLFTSGYTEDVITNHGVLKDRFAFIGKPYTPSELAKKVREVLDR